MTSRIAIVGAGAIGLYYGAKLARAGGDVHFLLRSDFEAVRRDGILVRGDGEEFRVPRVNAYTRTSDIGECDLVIIAVKTTSNDDLLELIPPLLKAKTALLTLQNGLGNEEFLATHFGVERVLGGLCFACLIRVAPGIVEHYDRSHLRLGELRREPSARIEEIEAQCKASGISCSVADDLATERWRKLVWNIPFNGLAVTSGGADTSAILQNPELRERTRALMAEVICAANACGRRLERKVADEQIARTETMGRYKPSTLLDFEAGRPIELEAIWGEPLRRAKAAGAHVPEMETLYAELQQSSRAKPRDPAALAARNAAVSLDCASLRSG